MALNWDIGNIPNYKRKCFRVVKKGEQEYIEDLERYFELKIKENHYNKLIG
jgi:hypothetical protein